MVRSRKSAAAYCKRLDAIVGSVELMRGWGKFFRVAFGDVKTWIWVPCFVGAVAFARVCHAGADLNLSANFRSYPLSGVIEVQSGYGIMLYGAESSPFSGYLRLGLGGATAGSYNSGAAVLEVFPLGILGVRAGGESIQNDKDYTAYACELYGCQGRYYRMFVEGELTLGYGGVFMQGRVRRERWTPGADQAGDFVDPTSGLLMSAVGESQTVYSALLGYKWSDSWATLAGLRYAEGDAGDAGVGGGISQMPFALLRFTSGSLSLGIGGGAFKSELKPRDSMVLGYISWDIWPSVKLK